MQSKLARPRCERPVNGYFVVLETSRDAMIPASRQSRSLTIVAQRSPSRRIVCIEPS